MLAKYPPWFVYLLAAIALLRFPAIVAIWLSSRSGVVAYVALSIGAMILGTTAGMPSSIVGLVGVVILCFLVRNSWHHMPWGLR